MVLGVAGLTLDGTLLYLQKRKLQSATDLAAIAAAGNPAQAQAAAIATLAANGFPASAIASIENGVYTADGTLPSGQRFAPQASAGNAVRLITQIQTTPFFGKAIAIGAAWAASSNVVSMQTANAVTVGARAVALQANRAAFAIGTRLVGLNGGVANALLGGLLGTNLSLSLMDYQALASTNIDLFEFSGALATRLHMTGASFDQVAAASVQLPTILAAMADATHGNAQAASALQAVGGAVGSRSLTLAPVMSFGPYGGLTAATSGPLVAAVSALDLLSAVAQVSNGTNQILVNLGASVPGLLGASAKLAVGERPVGSSFVTVGAQGASLHTAQTRLLINVSIGPVALTSVTVPLYVELASGVATLQSIACNPLAPSNVTVTLGVTPSVVDASIGSVSTFAFSSFTQAPSVSPATLLTLVGLASVTGQAHAAMSNTAPTAVTYTAADIAAATRKTTSTTQYTTSLTSSLLGNLSLQTQILGLGIGVPANLSQQVSQALSAATSPIDQLLAAITAALGLGLGQADTWVTGTRCGGGVLVN